MATYKFVVDIAAPRDQVFALWTNLDRMHEWIEGMTDVIDRLGPVDQVGSTYVVRFPWAKSPTTVIAADRPAHYATRFGNSYLRGENVATLEETGAGTRLTQEFRVHGLLPRILARIWGSGSYKGSFRGELNHFKQICEREAAGSAKID